MVTTCVYECDVCKNEKPCRFSSTELLPETPQYCPYLLHGGDDGGAMWQLVEQKESEA